MFHVSTFVNMTCHMFSILNLLIQKIFAHINESGFYLIQFYINQIIFIEIS